MARRRKWIWAVPCASALVLGAIVAWCLVTPRESVEGCFSLLRGRNTVAASHLHRISPASNVYASTRIHEISLPDREVAKAIWRDADACGACAFHDMGILPGVSCGLRARSASVSVLVVPGRYTNPGGVAELDPSSRPSTTDHKNVTSVSVLTTTDDPVRYWLAKLGLAW